MGLRTFLGPMLNGTVKNTNALYPTTPGQMRNTGPGDAYQFGQLSYTQTTSTSNLTFTAPNTGATQVMVLPAGSYIDNINVDILTAFNAGTNNSIIIAITPTNGTAGTIIFELVGTAVTLPVGRYLLGTTGTGIATWSGAGANTNIPYWTNISYGQATPTDQIVQAYFTGTGTAATTGSAIITVDYALRNPDTSYFPQTPTSPIANPPVQTY